MTQNQFRDLILTQIRKILPEIPSWQDMIRYLRMRTGHNIESPDQLDYSNELIAAEENAFVKYAYTLQSVRTSATIDVPANTTDPFLEFNYTSTHILIPTDIAYSRSSTDRPELFPQKSITKPPLWSTTKHYTVPIWYINGSNIGIVPNPKTNIRVFLHGIMKPHYDTDNNLVGVDPGDEHSIALYAAGELIEAVNPQLGITWKQSALRDWSIKRQQLAWHEAVYGRNRQTKVF
jgi:hypothetical protein